MTKLFHLTPETLEILIRDDRFPRPIDYYGECWPVEDLREFIITQCAKLGYSRQRVEDIFARANLLPPRHEPANDNNNSQTNLDIEITKAVALLRRTQEMSIQKTSTANHPVVRKPVTELNDPTKEITKYVAAHRRWFG